MPLAAAVPDQPPDQPRHQDASLLAVAEAGLRAVRLIALPYAALAVALAAVLAAPAAFPTLAWLAELRRSGLAALALAALLVALAGLAAAWTLARARRNAARYGDALLVGRVARLPQALVVVPLAGLAGLCAWMPGPLAGLAVPPADLCAAIGGAAIVLAFPLLVAERSVAAVPEALLPEAPALRALLLLPVLVWPALGGLEIAAGLGAPVTVRLAGWLGLLLALVAAELAVRALLRLFLPPPPAEAARAAVHSTLAGLLAAAPRGRATLADPIRAHLGIDFARSWALAYVRRALPAVSLLLLVFCWGLSGVVLVGLDRRAVYERFGAPVAVLHPGAHLILPWPLGRLRWLDYGTLHEMPLGSAEDTAAPEPIAAEALPPPSADRMWERAHPAEVMLLTASQRAGQQGFQTVSLDLRMLWRAGMGDADALRLAYRAADPQALVRSAAGRATTQFFSARTLDDVLGENRAAMSDGLRAAMQQRLDAFASGIEVVAVVIEAIHPPVGAADAYHAVQAAEIAANASISAERGRAQGALAVSRQTANALVDSAQAAAAEQTGTARADLARFAADRAASGAGGEAFLLERYFAALTNALTNVPLTILDHRVEAADAPVLDIRPPAYAPAPASGTEGE
jgi:regulator of protease activity HflC (stomatin/prohibitin superfamily)